MYDPKTDQKAKVNTSDINEDLGQIEYLFSDKTGTLTENEMIFKQFSINGIIYEEINVMSASETQANVIRLLIMDPTVYINLLY